MIETLVTASVLCNLLNLNSYPCNAPVAHFEQVDGDYYGELESGIPFSQKNVLEGDYGRIMRFQMQDYFHFVTDKGVIYADDELQALSKYLTL